MPIIAMGLGLGGDGGSPGSGAVDSVNGRTGAVLLEKADVGLDNVVNTDTTTTANITDSSNKRFVTDAQRTVLTNTSGANSGDVTLDQNGFNFVSLTGQTLTLNAIAQSEVTGLTDALGAKLTNPLTTRGDILYRNDSTTTRLAIGASDTIPTSNGTDLVYAYPQRQNLNVLIRQNLGGGLLFETIDFTVATTAVNLVDGRMNFQAIYVPYSTLVTGAIVFLATAGVFTGDAENSVSLYSYSGGTVTRIAITANNENIWKTLGYAQYAFTSPVTLNKGVYFVGYLYNNSAQTTAPALRGGSLIRNALGETNSAKLDSFKGATTAAPASEVMSALTTTTPNWIGLY